MIVVYYLFRALFMVNVAIAFYHDKPMDMAFWSVLLVINTLLEIGEQVSSELRRAKWKSEH